MGEGRIMATFDTRIVWGDCDEQGIVFYPTYFYWMDSAFQGLLRDAGLNMRELRERGELVGLPIVQADARFLSSASYEDVLRIEARIANWGGKSFRVEYKGHVGERAIFEGFEIRVFLTTDADGRPAGAQVPGKFRNALGG
jgi:4-hydroxybenzoyl-CoA thioesterase